MSDLTLRAEQGVLGAMLLDTHTTLITDNVEVDDFDDPTHRAVYQALRETDLMSFDSLDERITVVVATTAADIDAGRLRQLADLAPGEELIGDYTRIVVQAAFERDLAGFAQPYHHSAELATDPQTQAALRRLGDVLDAQVAFFGEPPTTDPVFDIAVTGHSVELDLRFVLHREDQIIADILQHRAQAREVATWLDPEVFTTGQRRTTFELAVSLAYDNDPFDTVTLAWHLNRAQNITRYLDPATAPPTPMDVDYEYLNRLAGATVTTGTAVVVGRELLIEHTQAQHAIAVSASTQRIVHVQQTAPPTQQQTGLEVPLSPAPAADIRPIELGRD